MARYEIIALPSRFVADARFCLNDAGRVAGIVKVGERIIDGERQARTWVATCDPLRRNGREPRILPGVPKAAYTDEQSVGGINRSGDVIGSVGTTTSGAITLTVSDAVFWPATGKPTVLAGQEGLSVTLPNGLNAGGVIVGEVGSGSVMETKRRPDGAFGPIIARAVRWEQGRVEILFDGVATAINDRGEVVGYSGDPDISGKALLWRVGRLHTLCDGMALAINNRGQIVGKQYMERLPPENSLPRSKAFSWRDGRFTLLRELPKSEKSTATAVNEQGEILGDCDGKPTLWRDGKPLELQSLLPSRSGWELLKVRCLNNLGQMVGMGELRGKERGFLLTPRD